MEPWADRAKDGACSYPREPSKQMPTEHQLCGPVIHPTTLPESYCKLSSGNNFITSQFYSFTCNNNPCYTIIMLLLI